MRDRFDPTVVDHVLTIRRAWRPILVVAVLVAGAIALATSSSGRTTVTSLVQVDVTVPDNGLNADYRAGTLVEIASRPGFVREAAAGAQQPVAGLDDVTVRVLPSPGLIEVEATADSEAVALLRARAIVTALTDRPLTPAEEAVGMSVTEVTQPTIDETGRAARSIFPPALALALVACAEAAVLLRFLRGGLSPGDPADDLRRSLDVAAWRLDGPHELDVARAAHALPADLGAERTGAVALVPLGSADVSTAVESSLRDAIALRTKSDPTRGGRDAEVEAEPELIVADDGGGWPSVLAVVARDRPDVVVAVDDRARRPGVRRAVEQLREVGARSVAAVVVPRGARGTP